MLTTKIPRFSNIVGSEVPVIQSPRGHENGNALPAPEQRQFNPRVAGYTLAFITVLIGGLVVGAKSKDYMDRREVSIFVVS